MLDIRSTSFLSCPKEQIPELIKKEGIVGIVGGLGFVGNAAKEFFKDFTSKVLVYDRKESFNTLSEVVNQAHVIFLCLPTPMRQDGSCHTDIIVNVLQEIKTEALALGRPLDSFVVVLKSTVPVGFTAEMQERYFPMRITFCPEFLTEKNAVEDFKNCNRFIVAGEEEDANVVLTFICAVVYDRAMGTAEYEVVQKYSKILENPQLTKDHRSLFLLKFSQDLEKATNKRTMLCHESEPMVAELAKLFTNGILATKVIFCNEIYKLCEKINIPYDEVRAVALLDERIGRSHTQVPGHDGDMGFSGSCFCKDLNNLICLAKEAQTAEKLFSTVWERNKELRPGRDWEKLEGRAVVDK